MRYVQGQRTGCPWMDIKGVQGYFNDMRIDRDSVPEWLRFWKLPNSDNGSKER